MQRKAVAQPTLLQYAIHALDGINHGICATIENHSTITPTQIYCMIELVSGAF